LNGRAAAIQATFDMINDPSYSVCADQGLVRQASTVKPLRITQHSDRVVFDYEEGAVQRVVYFDGHGPSSNGRKTNLGQSIARYENGALIIETSQLLNNLTGVFGNELSDQHSTVETYRRNDDENGREPESNEHTLFGRHIARYDGDILVIETTQLLGNLTSQFGNILSDQATVVETYRRIDEPGQPPAIDMRMIITDIAKLTARWEISSIKYLTADAYDFIEVDCRLPNWANG
jgi:hypothetical protein